MHFFSTKTHPLASRSLFTPILVLDCYHLEYSEVFVLLVGLFSAFLFRCQFPGEIAVYAMRCDAMRISYIPEKTNITVIFDISIPAAGTILFPEKSKSQDAGRMGAPEGSAVLVAREEV